MSKKEIKALKKEIKLLREEIQDLKKYIVLSQTTGVRTYEPLKPYLPSYPNCYVNLSKNADGSYKIYWSEQPITLN